MSALSAYNLDDLENRYPSRSLPAGAEVVRVAPSPTGNPHIGTALQATIDFALARQTDGVFILRIEDTDRVRLVEGAIDEIVRALDWLGLHPDEGPGLPGEYGPYIESERLDIYQSVAHALVERGSGYPCFCTPERLTVLREEQKAAGLPTGYDRRCRALSSQERERLAAETERPPVIRLAMPREGTIGFDDAARGRIEFNAADQDDPVLLKSDGYPTYHLAAIVDDHLMRVTTVVRGEEWVSSTPKHLVLQEALGWTAPAIVHTPLLRDAQGRKLSKRTGDTSVRWFREQGFLPEAFRNFLTRIIWTHPEGKDVYPFDDFIRHVRPSALPKTGPVANLTLLDFICGEYIRALEPAALFDRVTEWMGWLLAHGGDEVTFEVAQKQGRSPYPMSRESIVAFQRAFGADRAFSERVLALEPERYHTLADVILQNGFYYRDLFRAASPDLLLKQTKGDGDLARRFLQGYLDRFSETPPHEAWEVAVDSLATELGVSRRSAFMLLRVGATGADRTPPLYPIMGIVGDAEVRRRLELAVGSLIGSQFSF
jgi:glutamyl-tRNA synthetase